MAPIASHEALQDVMETQIFLKEFGNVPRINTLSIESTLKYIYESERNYAAINMELQSQELSYYAKHGTTISEAASGATASPKPHSNWLSNIINWFRRQFDRLGGLYRLIADKIEQLDLANKTFVSKYKTLIDKAGITDIEYKGYSFQDLDKRQPKVYKTEFSNNIEANLPSDYVDEHRVKILKAVFGVSDTSRLPTESSKLADVCKQCYFRSDAPKTMRFNIKEQFKYIDESNGIKRTVNNIFKPAKAQLAATVRYYENLRNNITICTNSLNDYTEVAKFNAMVINVSFSEYIRAIIARCNQAKHIVRAALGKPYKESVEVMDTAHIQLRPTTVQGIFDKLP